MVEERKAVKPRKIPGITRADEEKMLTRVLRVADANLNRTRESVQSLANDLHALQEVYDASDKEGLAQWFNTDARFQQVRQELLRSERSRKRPYFGRIDFTDRDLGIQESYYIGRSVIAKEAAEPMVIDWRAPIASVYYEKSLGKCTYSVLGEGAYEIDLSRKRTYEIENDQLKDFYDTDVVANDDLLTKYLARNKRAVLSEIIATIQQEQNEIIRKKPQHNVLVQGSAGSGKTTVAMHRISYILYNYELEFKPESFYIIGSNKILLNYITGILPDLDVYGITQMTMEQLFVRLMYEDWDPHKYAVKRLNKRDISACQKGTFQWFQDLEDYCERYEWDYIPRDDIYAEKTKHLLVSREYIERFLKEHRQLSIPDKLERLTEYLIAQLENEIYGRNYSYPEEEQKRLLRRYQTYFGRKEWKGSVFELYDNFLLEQNAKGKAILPPDREFDVYDLAALAYLYKRIKETEVIQEASHVVIDEAQDFGMMVYGCLKYCLTKCTYTIMGDVSQNIYFDYGLSDWEELRSLMLPGEYDYFGLLRKSYRNTVEISNFATNILQHGSFPIYPVEPIIRHGAEVRVTQCEHEEALAKETIRTVRQWQQNGYETVGIICTDEKEADRVNKLLQPELAVSQFDAETSEFGSGVMILPIEYAKGLEFDVVLLFNADAESYPAEDGFAKLLYVAATRALHELVVLYCGTLTELIAAPVPERRQNVITEVKPKAVARRLPEEQVKTKAELAAELAREGQREMELRKEYGPRRIEAKKPQTSAAMHVKTASTGRVPIAQSQSPTAFNRVRPVIAPQEERIHTEFGGMPEGTSLKPLGHSRIDTAVKWLTRSYTSLELTSAYGLLRITPVSDDTVRISFAKGQFDRLPEIPQEIGAIPNPKWDCRESRDMVELKTNRLLVRVDKKTGAASFYTAGGRLLLSESAKLPRQIEASPKQMTWNYFDWTKKEILKARGASDQEWLDIVNAARYISLGAEANRPACLMSNNGYQLLIPAGIRAMCCSIPVYGPYLATEGTRQIDYFFRTAL